MHFRKTVLLLLISSLFSVSSFALTKIQGLEFKKSSNKGILRVSFKGEIEEYPDFKVIGDTIVLKIKKAKLSKTIDRYEKFSNESRDTRLRAYYADSNTIKVKAAFPFKMEKYKDLVALTIKDRHIELTFPKIKSRSKRRVLTPVTSEVKKPSKSDIQKSAQVTKDILNESYLKSLENNSKKSNPTKSIVADTVKTTLAANQKAPANSTKSSFSLASYAGKFVAFLAVILLGFYGVVVVMKKGFIKKGKLGFLNNTNQVTVLSQTHIAPKKSLMLIKAHNQVFLVSNTDAGIHPISEINDVSGLLKDGEKIIAGNNFDDSLESVKEPKVTLKKDITQSNKASSLSEFMGTKDKVKFSEQLKKKVKNLKPLQ